VTGKLARSSVNDGSDAPNAEKAVFGKVMRRLLPLLFVCYIVAFLDRVNVGFAKLQMAGDLGFSDAVYGFGAGVFFIGYFLFEVPSNLILKKVGARIWIARIMITWGIISSAFMFTGVMRWGQLRPCSAATMRNSRSISCGYSWARRRRASFLESSFISPIGFRPSAAARSWPGS
jgi:hypothetical protein